MLKRLYAAVLIEVGSRRAYLLGVTDHPTSSWAAQVAREFAADLEHAWHCFTRLIRDRDAKFTDATRCSAPSASRSCAPRHRRRG
jgi:putative transposase